MAFDPKSLKKFSRKGNFKVSTVNNEQKVSLEDQMNLAEQDLLMTKLNATKRQEKNTLLLPQLFPIKGKKVQLYNDALRSLGVEVTLDEQKTYHIDKMGFCPELAFESHSLRIPFSYLDNNFIILSQQQATASFSSPQYSFLDDFLNIVYTREQKTIDTFTRGEAIVGSFSSKLMKLGIESFIAQKEHLKSDQVDITGTLETPSEAISKYREIDNVIKAIEDTTEYVTNEDLMRAAFETTGELKKYHKQLSVLSLPQEGIYHEVPSFRYISDELELFYFNIDQKPTFILFTENSDSSVHTHVTDDYAIIDGNNQSQLINYFLDRGMFDYCIEQVESVRDSYRSEVASGLLSSFHSLTNKQESSLSKDWHARNQIAVTLRLSSVEELKQEVPESYLNTINIHERDQIERAYIKSLPVDLKGDIIFPVDETNNTLLCDLISRIHKSEDFKTYRNSEEFIQKLSSLAPKDIPNFIENINSNLYFTSQNNLLSNLYLSKHFSSQVQEAGITLSYQS